MTRSTCRLIHLKAAYVFRRPHSRRWLVLKVKAAKVLARSLRKAFLTERTALELLQGLAVPRVMDLPGSGLARSGLRKMVGLAPPPGAFIVETYEGQEFHDHRERMPVTHRLGAWLFCMEQLVAFRRRHLIYSDIKCHNIVVRSRRPWRIIIIDFDGIIPVGRRRGWNNFASTRGYEPPEINSGKPPTEASCVYQLAMLLVHFLTNSDNRRLEHRRYGIPRVRALLARIGGTELCDVIVRSLHSDARKRPRNVEALLRRVRILPLPEESLSVWRELRAPYQRALAELGLTLGASATITRTLRPR
jgi:serine/threonine protein kinase